MRTRVDFQESIIQDLQEKLKRLILNSNVIPVITAFPVASMPKCKEQKCVQAHETDSVIKYNNTSITYASAVQLKPKIASINNVPEVKTQAILV